MSGTENDNSTRMKNAEERLARAIGRLEAALDAQASSAMASSSKTLDPGLAEELSRLQTENVELRTQVGRASERLDGTIAKLKTHLTG